MASPADSSSPRPHGSAATTLDGGCACVQHARVATPTSGILGAHPASHQALLAAPQPGVLGAYSGPPAPPAASPYGAYGAAYSAPGNGVYSAPQPAPGAWDPALLAALQQPPPYSGGGGDWFMDSGATAHMFDHPGNLSSVHPTSTPSHIIIGNSVGLPILTLVPLVFTSNSRPLSLSLS
mgnify:CR=1 FL=1